MEKASYLDRLAEHGINSAHPGGMALTRALLAKEKITPDTTLLDAGCGTGQTAAYIGKRYGCKITAVDIHPGMLEKARQKLAELSLNYPVIRADVMDLPFPKSSFDMILSESVAIFTNIQRTLQEYFRVLTPGGLVLAIEATALEPLTGAEADAFREVLGIDWLPLREEWCQMFQDTDFTQVSTIFTRPMNWALALLPKLNRTRARAFDDYSSVLWRYRKKFGYGVYRCRRR